MNKITHMLLAGLVAIAAIFSGLVQSTFPSQAHSRWYTSLPSCSHHNVLENIIKRYNKADRTLWYDGVKLRSISHTRERSGTHYPYSSINRRYCRAKAHLSNGRHHTVHYLVEEGMGLAGFKWGVDYCLTRTDRWHAYDGWCRVLRR